MPSIFAERQVGPDCVSTQGLERLLDPVPRIRRAPDLCLRPWLLDDHRGKNTRSRWYDSMVIVVICFLLCLLPSLCAFFTFCRLSVSVSLLFSCLALPLFFPCPLSVCLCMSFALHKHSDSSHGPPPFAFFCFVQTCVHVHPTRSNPIQSSQILCIFPQFIHAASAASMTKR